MRRALFSVGLLLAAACGAHGRDVGTASITGAPMITTGPQAGESELPRSLKASAQRIATEACKHEEHCGRGDVASCMDATVRRARTELRRWNCEPAAVRARFEECLVNFDSLMCEAGVGERDRPLCPPNVECNDHERPLIDPGPALARIWGE